MNDLEVKEALKDLQDANLALRIFTQAQNARRQSHNADGDYEVWVEFACDFAGCARSVEFTAPIGMVAAKINEVFSAGWSRHGECFCPLHAR